MSSSTNRKAKVFRGDNAQFGVQDHHGCVIYEAMFTREQAKRIAELESSAKPPKDWYATEKILTREGLLARATA